MLQLIVKLVLLSLSDQMCLDSSVLFEYFLIRKESLLQRINASSLILIYIYIYYGTLLLDCDVILP